MCFSLCSIKPIVLWKNSCSGTFVTFRFYHCLLYIVCWGLCVSRVSTPLWLWRFASNWNSRKWTLQLHTYHIWLLGQNLMWCDLKFSTPLCPFGWLAIPRGWERSLKGWKNRMKNLLWGGGATSRAEKLLLSTLEPTAHINIFHPNKKFH